MDDMAIYGKNDYRAGNVKLKKTQPLHIHTSTLVHEPEAKIGLVGTILGGKF